VAEWQPGTSGPVVLTATVSNAASVRGLAEITLNVQPDPTTVPILQTITNGASYSVGQPVAPGSWITLRGAELAPENKISYDSPLPDHLGTTSVRVGDRILQLNYAGPNQINAVLPADLKADTSLPVVVTRDDTQSIVRQVFLAQPQPAIFTSSGTGTGQGSIALTNSVMIAGPASDRSRPAPRGETISIYATGLGKVTPPDANGLSHVTSPVTVEIGGKSAKPVTFAGLAPGFVGLYQVNVQVPLDAPTGDDVEVVIVQENTRTPPVTMAVSQ